MALNIGELVGTIGLEDTGFGSGLSSAFDKLQSFGGKAGIALGALGAGGALAFGAGLAGAMSTEEANAKMTAQLGLTEQESGRIGAAAGAVYAQGYGESLDAVNGAITSVVQNIDGMRGASQEDLEGVATSAMTVADVMGEDVGAVTKAVAQMMRTGLASNAQEAFDVITRGAQSGNNKAEDLLDTFNEYSTQFRKVGLDGTAAMGLISQGLQAGARDADIVADSIKEFSIRAIDGSKTTAEGFQALGLDAEQMGKQIAGGGQGASDGLQTVLDKLRGMKDPVAQSAAAVALFGTQAEDMGQALYALDPAHAVDTLGQVAGATETAGNVMGDTAANQLEQFKRQISSAFVDFVGGKALPVAKEVATFLNTNFGPALSAVSSFVSGTLVPALGDMAHWIDENKTPIMVIVGLIAAVFLPHLIAVGTQSLRSGAQMAWAWVTSKAEAISSAAVHSAQILMMIGRWIAMGATAIAQAAVVVGSWIAMAAGAVAQGAIIAATWLATQVRTVASLAVMAAGFVAQGAAMVASAAMTAAGVVAGWVMMGVQSLIQAARMAAAWVIAMGPVGWVIAAVIGLVALIIANWDTVKSWTVNIFNAVWGFIQNVWSNIVSGVRNAVNWVLDAVGWIGQLPGRVAGWFGSVYSSAVGKLGDLLGWLRGLPGMILGALGNLGSLLLSAGGDIMSGLWNGIKGAAGWVKDRIIGLVRDIIPGPVAKVLGIASPSKVMAELGRWVPAGLAQGIEGASGVVATASRDLAGLVTSNMSNLRGTVALNAATGGGGFRGGDPFASSLSGQGRALVHIEKFEARENQTPGEIAHDLEWLARGGGG